MTQSITQCAQQAEWSCKNIGRDCVTFSYKKKVTQSLALNFKAPLFLSLAKYIGCSADRGMWSATHQTTSLHCMTLFFLTKQIWSIWGFAWLYITLYRHEVQATMQTHLQFLCLDLCSVNQTFCQKKIQMNWGVVTAVLVYNRQYRNACRWRGRVNNS